jgi:hypothetical protein
MELRTVRIRQLGTRGEVVVLPLGDIQYTGRDGSTVRTLLKEYVQRGLDAGAWFLGMGDYTDFTSPSNRVRLAQADLYDTATAVIDNAAHHLVVELYRDILKPTKGRWLGLLQGHHFHQYRTGLTTDVELCELLEAPFLGTCAYVRVVVETGRRATSSQVPFTIWCHHGEGSGQSVGAPLLKLERMANSWDADVFLIGHQSKLVSAPIERIYPVWGGNATLPELHHRKIILACTGSFSRGYVPHARQGRIAQGDYVEKKMLTPAHLGGVIVRLQYGTRSAQGRKKITKDIRVEL